MRILVVHNRYKFAGGEDAVVQAEKSMLQGRGHDVALLEADNATISGALRQISTGFGAVYSIIGKRRVSAELARFRPSVMHVHNFFPLFSPSIYRAAREAGVAVVQTLHNYRLLCPNRLFLRQGHICEDCMGKAIPLPGVLVQSFCAMPIGSMLFSLHLSASQGAMMKAAERDRELVADAAAKGGWLGEPDVMAVRQTSLTDQAGQRSDEFEMRAVA